MANEFVIRAKLDTSELEAKADSINQEISALVDKRRVIKVDLERGGKALKGVKDLKSEVESLNNIKGSSKVTDVVRDLGKYSDDTKKRIEELSKVRSDLQSQRRLKLDPLIYDADVKRTASLALEYVELVRKLKEYEKEGAKVHSSFEAFNKMPTEGNFKAYEEAKKNFDALKEEINSTYGSVGELEKRFDKVSRVIGGDPEKVNKVFDKYKEGIESTIKSVEKLYPYLNDAEKGMIDGIAERFSALNSSNAPSISKIAPLADLRRELSRTEDELRRGAISSITEDIYELSNSATKAATSAITLENSLSDWDKQSGVDHQNASINDLLGHFRDMRDECKKAEGSIKELAHTRDTLLYKSNEAINRQAEAQGIKDNANPVNIARSFLPGYTGVYKEAAKEQEKLYQKRKAAEARLEAQSKNRKEASSRKALNNGWKLLGSTVKTVTDGFIRMGATVLKWVGRTAVTATKTLIHSLKSLATVAANVSGKLITLFGHASMKGIKALSKGVGTLSKGFFEVSKSLLGFNLLKSIGSSIGGFIQRIARLASLAFVFRVITQGFRQLKNDVVNAFGTYLNYDSALNSSVNTLKVQLATLKAQLASAFSPIISLIVPALSTLVGWCVSAANGISALIASLTGRTSWKKAVVNSVGSVGDAASGAADDLGDAADAADELKEKLGNYDKLNVIGDEDSSKAGKSSGGKGAGGGAGKGADISYVDQSIGDDIKGLADWLKDMWAKADFSELGRAVGEHLLKGLQSIPWKKIQKQAEKVAKSITSFLRGFLTTPGLAKEIGRSFGELINTGITFAKTFVQTFPFKELGQFLSKAINSAIETIDFHGAGETVRDGINGILKTWKELVDHNTGVDFTLLGTKVADFVKTALDVNWDLLKQNFENTGVKFGEFINALAKEGTLTTIGGAIDHFIEGLTAGFKSLVEEVDFTTLGEDIGGAIKAIGDSLSNSLLELSTLDIGAKLKELMDGIRSKVTPEDFKTWGTSLGSALGTAIAGLADAIYENRDYIYECVRNFVGGIVEGASGKLTEDKFTEIGNTLTTWLSNAITDLANWLLDPKNQKQLKANLKALLNGAADGWKPGTGGKLGKAIKVGLGVIFDTITEWCSDEDNIKKAGDEVKGFLDGLLGNGDGNLTVDDFATLGDNLRSLGDDVVEKITKWINDPNGLQKVLDDLETFCDSLFGDQDGVLTMSDVTSFLDKVYGWLKTNVGSIFQASPVIAKLALFFLALKSGFAGQLLKIGLKAAGSFGSGLLKQLGIELTKKKIEGTVSESTLKGVGTSWGDVLGLAMGAAIAIKIGNEIRKELETYEWDNGGFFANSRNKSVMEDDRLEDWQKQIYKSMWDSGLWEDSPVFDFSQLDLKNVLASLDDEGLDFSAIQELRDTILKLDPSKVEDVRDRLVDLRDTGIVPFGTASDSLNGLINALTGDLIAQNEALTNYSGSMAKSATDSDKARVSYNTLKDAINYLGTEAGLDKDVVDELNSIVDASAGGALSMGDAYDTVVDRLQHSSKAGQEWANVLQHRVHEQLNKLDDIKVSDLTSKVDELSGKWGLTGGEIQKVKDKINEFPNDGKKAFAGLIEGLAESKNGATGLKDVIASQLGIEVSKLGENSILVKGMLNELFNPDNTEEGRAKVNKILQAIGLDIDKVNEKDAKVKVEAETEKADGKLDTTKGKTEELDGKEADITAKVDSTDADETFVALDTSVDELDGSTISIKGDAEDLRTMLENSAVDISTFEGANGTVIVDFEGNKWSFDTTDEAVKGVIEEYKNKTVTTDFIGEDNVSEGAKSAEETANTVPDEKTITFKADTEDVDSGVSSVDQQMQQLVTEKTIYIYEDGTRFEEENTKLVDGINAVPNEKTVTFTNVGGDLLSAFATGILAVALALIPSEKTITFKVDNQTTEPLNTIKTAITGVAQHTNTQLDAIKGSVNSALGAIKSAASNALTGASGSVKSTINSLSSSVKTSCTNMANNFKADFNKARDAAVGALNTIQQRINSLHGKTVTVDVVESGLDEVNNAISSLPNSHTVTVYIDWEGATDVSLTAYLNWAKLGGVYKNGNWSDLPQKAEGGIFSSGFWRNIPAYASGTARAHGSLFVAGEAGPELVSHIGGRTEVLNKSQIASAIYSAVSSAMSSVLSAAANAVIQTLVNAANSVNYNLSALSNAYRQSSMYTQELAFAIEGFRDVGALRSYYNTSYAPATNVDRLADEVARRISGNFYINNQMTLDGRVVYDEMVAIDRTNVRLTGKSGFGG